MMNKASYILGIETSCDETACAVVKDGKEILSNIVSSQINTHSKFGGVIPEVASRIHVENISLVVEEAISASNIAMEDLDAIAVTYGPGLVGCLHVGLIAAKTLAFAYKKPLVAVNHLAGHIYANRFISDLKFPLLALVVSGGHSELVYMPADYKFEPLGSTCDDAIGEAYDKTARLLGLGYPGGPIIDKLAKSGKSIYEFPKVKVEGIYDFSFSGIKSAAIQLLKRLEKQGIDYKKEDIAASFQEAALKQLTDKSRLALNNLEIKQFVLAGGVAANSRLRELVLEDLQKEFPEVEMIVPPLWCCTDNAAMIAAAGYTARLKGNQTDYFKSADSGAAY